MSDKYILVNGEPVEADWETWSRWFDKNGKERVLAQTDYEHVWVSTVFLAMDYNFGQIGKPVLWETMVFKNGTHSDIACQRYTSKEDALEGHDIMCLRYCTHKPENNE